MLTYDLRLDAYNRSVYCAIKCGLARRGVKNVSDEYNAIEGVNFAPWWAGDRSGMTAWIVPGSQMFAHNSGTIQRHKIPTMGLAFPRESSEKQQAHAARSTLHRMNSQHNPAVIRNIQDYIYKRWYFSGKENLGEAWN